MQTPDEIVKGKDGSMSQIVKDKSISRFKQAQGYAWEFTHHKDEFKKYYNKPKNRKKTLRTHREGKMTNTALVVLLRKLEEQVK
jgi:hypothetical protein